MIPIKTTQIVLFLAASLPVWVEADDLRLPATLSGPPAAGKKVAVTAPEYAGTGVHHMLYLPPDWQADWKAQGRSWPVIVEYTGNKAPSLGSTGLVEDAALGFGVSGGRFIWVVLPYVNKTHDQNEETWWGDEEATATYAKTNVPRICAEYGGDARAVFLCGFSRGAIGVNYIGLRDDEIARLWCAFLSHDHYDGVKEWKDTTWGTPLDAYRAAAADRLRRLNGRPVLVCQNNDTRDIEEYLSGKLSCADFAFLPVRTGEIFHEFPNESAVHPHTDRWLVKDSANRQQLWAWVDRVEREMHGADQGDAQGAKPVASWTFIADGDDWTTTLTESTGVCRDVLQPIGGQLRSGVLALGVRGGDPEYLVAPASEDLRLGPSYTIEAWVLPTRVTGWGRIVLQWGAEKQWAYHLAIRDGAASLYHGQADGTYRWCEGGVVRVGQKAHLVGVARRNDLQPSASSLELYLDGERVATAPFDGTVMRLEQVDVGIGDSAQAPSADARFRGYLPRVTVWNRALTPEEIRCRAADAGIAGYVAAQQQEIAAARRESMQRQLAERERLLDQLVALGAERIVVAERAPGRDYQQHYYANFGYSCVDPDYWLHGADGGRLLVLNLRNRSLEVLLDDPGGAVRDPQVHYGGQKILFSYRRGGTHHYNLYEINADGTGLRQLTDGPWDDVEPVYLPDGGIAFCSTRCQRYIGCWLAPSAILFRCDAQGGNIRMLSSGSFSENTPSVLPDGRLLYTRWEYVNRDAVSFHHLWTMNPDGTKSTVFYGNQQPGSVFIDARPIPDSSHVVLIDSPGHGQNEHAGRVATVSSSKGPNAQSALKHLTAQAAYRDPYPVQPGLYLAVRGNQLLVLSDGSAEQVLFDNDQMLHEPSVIQPRDREPVLPTEVDPAESTGKVVLQNAYIGRNMQGVPPGAIRRLLVLEDLPKPVNFHGGGSQPIGHGVTSTIKRFWGTVPVESDGSAHFVVPAGRSLYFALLDENDRSIKQMRSFVTVQAGETVGCVGCHEPRSLTGVPAGNARTPKALTRTASRIEPIAGISDVPDFPRDVQPILDRHCVRCHRPDQPEGGVTLCGDRGPVYSMAYYELFLHWQVKDTQGEPSHGSGRQPGNDPPYTTYSSASTLMDCLAGSHHEVSLTPHEQDQVRLWIDAGAQYAGTYAALGTGQIGGCWRSNEPIRVMADDWPETAPAVAAIDRRCGACHSEQQLPHHVTAQIPLDPWGDMLAWTRPLSRYSRHRIFNLSQPEKSLILLIALAKSAGGLATEPNPADSSQSVTPLPEEDRSRPPRPVAHPIVFTTQDDQDYRAILTHIQAAHRMLNTIKRFDMPGFQPNEHYIREMKRYGILPASLDVTASQIDPYETDRRYWGALSSGTY